MQKKVKGGRDGSSSGMDEGAGKMTIAQFRARIIEAGLDGKSEMLSWYERHVIKRLSSRISFYLVRTQVTPNQVTVWMILVGLCAAVFMGFGQLVVGTALLTFHLVLDKVDGDLARFRNASTMAGRYLDLVGHELVYVAVFGALTLALGTTKLLLAAGLVLTGGMVLLQGVFITKNAVMGEGLLRGQVSAQRVKESVQEGRRPGGVRGLYRRALAFLFRPGELYLILFGAAVLGVLEWVMVGYALVLVPVVLARVWFCFRSLKSLQVS